MLSLPCAIRLFNCALIISHVFPFVKGEVSRFRFYFRLNVLATNRTFPCGVYLSRYAAIRLPCLPGVSVWRWGLFDCMDMITHVPVFVNHKMIEFCFGVFGVVWYYVSCVYSVNWSTSCRLNNPRLSSVFTLQFCPVGRV